MMVLITYDVGVGQRRRQARCAAWPAPAGLSASACSSRCSRCEVDPAQWTKLRATLLKEIDPARDSLRFYHSARTGKRRVEHVGAKPALDLDGPLVF